MMKLRDWIDKNAKRPLLISAGVILFLQLGYLAFQVRSETVALRGRMERVVETVSLGIQQANRPLIESTIIAGLHYADAKQVTLCRQYLPT